MGRICYIYSHNEKSNAAKQLSRHLLVKRIRHEDSKFKGAAKKVVLNWGSSKIPYQASLCTVINPPEKVVEVSNKLSFFKKMAGKKLTPVFTEDQEEAGKWIDNGGVVVCRSVLSGSGGVGIQLAPKRSMLISAPLYVRYVPKKDEYRVHIFNGKVIDVQKKMCKHGEAEGANWQIRNHSNGFIYARSDISPPSCVTTVAKSCFDHFDIDFGAVDIIYTANQDRARALEINTAPGLEGQTIIFYADAIREYLK